MALAAAAHKIPLEVALTLVEMSEVARYAFEHLPGHRARHEESSPPPLPSEAATAATGGEEEAARLRAENALLRARVADDLALLHDLNRAPRISQECPPDLYNRLVAAVNNSGFLAHLEKIRDESIACQQSELLSTSMTEMEVGDVPNTKCDGRYGSWVLVACDNATDNLEEISGIDNDSYVIVNEDDIVDGIATFIARCILENPKSKLLSPVDLQKVVVGALGTMKDKSKWRSFWEAGKVIYILATWGITIAGLYKSRAVLKAAAKGAAVTAKYVIKAI